VSEKQENWWTKTVRQRLDNNEKLYSKVMRWIDEEVYERSDKPVHELAASMEVVIAQIENPILDPIYNDLLVGALKEVDWHSIAECYQENFKNLGGTKHSDGKWTWESLDDDD